MSVTVSVRFRQRSDASLIYRSLFDKAKFYMSCEFYWNINVDKITSAFITFLLCRSTPVNVANVCIAYSVSAGYIMRLLLFSVYLNGEVLYGCCCCIFLSVSSDYFTDSEKTPIFEDTLQIIQVNHRKFFYICYVCIRT